MPAPATPAPASRASTDGEWVWVLEVRLDGRWVLRNGPCASYEEALWHVNDSLREANNWRIRGGVDVGRGLRKGG